MATLANVRAGMAANLSALNGIQVSAYVLASPSLPVIWVRPAPDIGITYHQAMRNGLEEWSMLVQAYVADTLDIGAQKALDNLIAGSTSVRAALEADKTLGGAAQDLMVESCSGYRQYGKPDGTTAHGAEWSVLVYI